MTRKTNKKVATYYKKIITKYLRLLTKFYHEIAISKLQKTTPADNAVKLINQFSHVTGFSTPGSIKKPRRFLRYKKF